MTKLRAAALACVLMATVANAQGAQVKVTDLGIPQCAAITRTPDFINNTYEGNQFDNQRIISPWFRWPAFYLKHSQFVGMIGNSQTTSSGLYRFPETNSAAVTFVIGNPAASHLFHFWSAGKIVATINGAAIGSSSTDYYVSLSLVGAAADAFSFEVKSQQEAFMAWANFDAVCPQ